MYAYVQPVAQHASHPERLVVRSDDDQWYVWFGDRASAPLEAIDAPVALWMIMLDRVRALPEPHFWLHIDDLPVAGSAALRP